MPPLTINSEEELVLLLKQQSREAFDYLYANYSAALFGVISRIITDEQTAEDVLQESFVKIWKHIDQYSEAKGRIFTWMINVARNTAIDKTRSRGEVMKGKISKDENIVNILGDRSGREMNTDGIGLKNMIAGMKEEHGVILNLTYFNGYTIEETANKLDLPVGTVKTRMRSAIKILRAYFLADKN